MKTISFFGGSNLVGAGYPDGVSSNDIYPNIIARHGYNIENHGIAGASSYEIFLNVLQRITQDTLPDIVCIEWNTFIRYKFHPSPDFSIRVSSSPIVMPTNWPHAISLTAKELNKFQETLMLLDGEYQRILTLINYCNILQNLCDQKNINLAMFAGNTGWNRDLFIDHSKDIGKWTLSKHTKELLDFDNRDDENILELLSTLKNNFDLLDLKKWVFVFEDINSFRVDHAPLDKHPGPKTMELIAKKIVNFLKDKNL